MKIAFKNPDTIPQITNLQKLLQSTSPTEKDLVLTLLLIILIFYENRPGKLWGILQHHNIYGTGCHNPTSEKTGKTIRGIWRLELTIKHTNGMTLVIKYELMQGGYLTAVLKNGAKEKRVAADIFIDKHTNTDATSVSIKGGTPASITEELFTLLREPVEALSAVVSKGASV